MRALTSTALFVACLGAAGARADAPLTLERAVELAQARSERSLAAGAAAQAAQARLDAARAFFFPELAVGASYTRRGFESSRTVGTQTVVLQRFDALQANATLSGVLFDARSIPLYRAASASRDAAALEAREARRLAGYEAADAFLLALSAQKVAQATDHRVALATRALGEARARFEARLTSSSDVTRAELDVATAERDQTRAGGAAEVARLHLAFLLVLDHVDALAEPTLALPTAPPPTARDRAAEHRLDVAAARERTRAAGLLADEPLLRAVPSLTYSVQGRLTNEPGFIGRAYDYWGVLGLSWALFDGGERYAQAREQRANARAAALLTRALERQTGVQVETAQVAFRTAQASARQALVAAQVAARHAAETEERYRQGLATSLEAADARVRLFEAEVASGTEDYGRHLAWLNLRAALGEQAPGDAGEESR